MTNFDELIKQLKGDEGMRLKPYTDTVGKLTIGVGRNLTDVGISVGEAETLLWNDINLAYRTLIHELPWLTNISEARQGVLINMAFNLGVPGLLSFKNTLEAVRTGDYAGAARQMKDSKWAAQVGDRAKRLIRQMQMDIWQFAEE